MEVTEGRNSLFLRRKSQSSPSLSLSLSVILTVSYAAVDSAALL